MFEYFLAPGVRFYLASWVQDYEDKYSKIYESGWSLIIFGIGIACSDKRFNRNRKQWVIPKNAWRGKVEGF